MFSLTIWSVHRAYFHLLQDTKRRSLDSEQQSWGPIEASLMEQEES